MLPSEHTAHIQGGDYRVVLFLCEVMQGCYFFTPPGGDSTPARLATAASKSAERPTAFIVYTYAPATKATSSP